MRYKYQNKILSELKLVPPKRELDVRRGRTGEFYFSFF